jgi:hypothetical protein
MVIFFATLLAISILGLTGLLGVRRYEVTTGRVIFANVRPAVGHWLGLMLHFVERVAPATVRFLALKLYRRGSELAHLGTAWSVLYAERLLEQTLRVLRHSTSHEGGGEASAFLREVAEHKEQLKKSSGQGAIYEE